MRRKTISDGLATLVCMLGLLIIGVWLGVTYPEEEESPVIINQVIPTEEAFPVTEREEVWVDEYPEPLTIEEFALIQQALVLHRDGNATLETIKELFPDETDEKILEWIQEMNELFPPKPADVEIPVEVMEQENGNSQDSSSEGSDLGSGEVGDVPDNNAKYSREDPEQDEEQVILPEVVIYSPVSWPCPHCVTLKTNVQNRSNLPFGVRYAKRDGYSVYPHIEMNKPDGTYVKWTRKNPRNVDEMIRVYKVLWEGVSVEKLKLDSSQLRAKINSYMRPLPMYGTVVGQTVRNHLIQDHGYEPWQIDGLSEEEMHKLHQITHDETDGRVTAYPTMQNDLSNKSGNWTWSYGQQNQTPRRRGLFRQR